MFQKKTRSENKRRARIGIVGAGWWATQVHIPAILENPEAELVAVCDHSSKALHRVREEFGDIKTYHEVSEMLAHKPLDGVIIAVNHNAHYTVARACLEHGLHILLEKPMTLDAQEAHELVRLAAGKQVQIIVGYPYHYTETTQKAREILHGGELGAIQLVSCVYASVVIEFYRGNDEAYRPEHGYRVTGPGRAYADPTLSGGGQGHLQVTHIAGSLMYITGLEAERVSCFMDNWDVPVDLVDSINLKFRGKDGHAASGVIASTGNLAAGDRGQMELRVFCEFGYLILDQSNGTLEVRYHNGRKLHFAVPKKGSRYPSAAPSRNLVDIILRGSENLSPGSIGARVVDILDAAYKSARADGMPIQVDAPQVKTERDAGRAE